MEALLIFNSILINAPANKVWDALTNPSLTKQYMFGCETVSDWKTGSQLQWKMMHGGKALVVVTGHILKIEPEKILSYTVFDPNSNLADIPQNYLTVTYQLSDNQGQTVLDVTQGDYNKVVEGERRYKEAFNNGEGWQPILEKIKKLLEQ